MVDESKLEGGRAYVLGGSGKMFLSANSLGDNIPAHEFGHFLGINDHYHDGVLLGIPMAIPNKGWDSTLMGSFVPANLTTIDVEALWAQ